MSDEQKQPGQPALPPVEQETLISGKIVGILKKILYNGFPVAARFTKSVRVGSGTHSTFDGTDGVIIADGTSGQFLAYDIGGGVNLVQLYRDATTFYFGTTEGGAAVLAINATTGLITQAALTTLTAGTSINLSATGFGTQGTRLVKPTGMVYAQIYLTATGAIAAGSTVATITAAHRPTALVPIWGRTTSGGSTVTSGFISAAGAVALDVALANTDVFAATAVYMTS